MATFIENIKMYDFNAFKMRNWFHLNFFPSFHPHNVSPTIFSIILDLIFNCQYGEVLEAIEKNGNICMHSYKFNVYVWHVWWKPLFPHFIYFFFFVVACRWVHEYEWIEDWKKISIFNFLYDWNENSKKISFYLLSL